MDRIDENLWNLKVNNRVQDCFTLLYQSINQQSDGALMSLSPSSKIAIQ